MAITETMIANKCNMLLNNGTDSSGNVKTVNVSLGSLSDSGWDATKAMTVIETLSACLSKSLYDVQHIVTNRIEDTV